jgi:hypothetical protein
MFAEGGEDFVEHPATEGGTGAAKVQGNTVNAWLGQIVGSSVGEVARNDAGVDKFVLVTELKHPTGLNDPEGFSEV